MYRLALVSVSDKTGLVEFLSPLVKQGLTVVSTGGTAEHLKKNGINVKHVSEVTGFPEVMDGRVRTLHPKIHMSLLARSHVSEDMNLLREHHLEPFDLVIGNLYPFEKALGEGHSDLELAEYIDIGGPCLLRAAAKNYSSITVISDPEDYTWISREAPVNLGDRKKLAAKVFLHISSYDAMISQHLGAGLGENRGDSKDFAVACALVDKLRYGENPQQKAFWFRLKGSKLGLHEAEILHGKQLSYNNIVDLDSASKTLQEFAEPCVVGVKHSNPCGVAVGVDGLHATARAVRADPISIFGGIVATNVEVTLAMAQELDRIFLECIVAPEFSQQALDLLTKKKNLRILKWPNIRKRMIHLEVKSISGGLLVQTPDDVGGWNTDWKILGQEPGEEIKKDLLMSWKVAAHLKSNSIAICGQGQTLGLGMGQVNRVDAVIHAIERKKLHHQDYRDNLVLASDAFFPFVDSIERIHDAGIRWVIQPGGSVRDQEIFSKAQQLGINLIITGRRHFYH
ncbi:MAG: bifunctional phosphoribosylaminoimidazolecarboxamide formyltransferase/IMP cyclohydrolase [Pseudomonadota bacterium]|mgnify:CR=1 FL=1|nr:bifunctional phosphoribosylaminoimidazolecarboxamide formyltransferase/IMP cyclohydrolase [Pseudomonadota bacterium]